MDIRVLLWTTFVMTLIMTCTHTLFLPALFSILVMGIVPGTTYEIPAGFMLIVYPVLFFSGLYVLSNAQLLFTEPVQPTRPVDPRVTRTTKPRTRATKTDPASAKRRVRAVA